MIEEEWEWALPKPVVTDVFNSLYSEPSSTNPRLGIKDTNVRDNLCPKLAYMTAESTDLGRGRTGVLFTCFEMWVGYQVLSFRAGNGGDSKNYLGCLPWPSSS